MGIRKAVPAVAVVGAVAAMASTVSTTTGAGGASGSVEAATTGNDSELVRKIEIRENPGRFLPAMKLKRSAMPDLERGDELRVSAELAVTTDCTHPDPRCAGSPYTYDPYLDTELVLRAGSRSISLAADRRRCVQKPGDRQHHCIIPFHGIQAGATAERLGCAALVKCSLELLARAHNPSARSGQFLVVGGQQEDGRLTGDKGRINAIRLRGRPDRESIQAGLRDSEVPPDLKRRVIVSARLGSLEKGDVVEAWVDLRASVSHLPYPALVGSEIVLAEKPGAIHGGRFVGRVANLHGELTENAGTNCTQAQTPCPVFRTGLLKIREDSVNPRGDRVPLFLNVVVRTNNKLKPERPGDMIRLRDHGGLRVRIYGRS